MAFNAPEDIDPFSPSMSYGSILLSSLSTSGEIPIMLDSGIAMESEYNYSSFRRSITDPLPSSLSAGTLGPRRHLEAPRSPTIWTNSPLGRDSADSESVGFGYRTATSHSSHFLSPHADEGYYDKRSGSASQFTISAYISPSASQISLARSLPGSTRGSPNHSPWNSPLPSSDTINRRIFSGNSSQLSPSLTTSLSAIILAAGSALGSPSIASSLANEVQASAPRYQPKFVSSDSTSTITSRVEFPRSSSNFDDKWSTHGLSPVRTTFNRPPSPAPPLDLDDAVTIVREGPRLRTKSSSTTKSNDSGRFTRPLEVKSVHRIQPDAAGEYYCPDAPTPEPISSSSYVHDPPFLSWLENMRLELWIDQEGFRLVRPVFKLSTYTSPADDRGSDSLHSLVYGSAEFKPMEHQPFLFHNASLEPPPTLRKLTMASDDSRDFMSRQASLCIKSNGVYSVFGTESFDRGPPSPLSHSMSFLGSHHEPYKLNWRFEYMVEDSYVESTGRARPGGKTLTPISFSCSPGLLHPTNGKKVKLMQVFKKGLVPKLASAKVNLTHTPTVHADSATNEFNKENAHHSYNRSQRGPLKMHRRAYSSSAGTAAEEVDRCRYLSEGAQHTTTNTIRKSKAISFVPPPTAQPQGDANKQVITIRDILSPVDVTRLLEHGVHIMD